MESPIVFANSSGIPLSGILNDAGKGLEAPLVVLCHGFSSNKQRHSMTAIVASLAARGIATFRFDFYGHGESSGKFEDITLTEAMDDTEHALALVRGRGYTEIGLFGSSFGGMTALLVGATHPELFALVLKAPVSDYLGKIIAQKGQHEIAEWKTKGFIWYHRSAGEALRLNYSFFSDTQKHSGYAAAPKLTMPVLIIHGDADITVPLAQSEKTASLIPGCTLEVIPGADHRFSQPAHFERMIALIATFFVEQTSR